LYSAASNLDIISPFPGDSLTLFCRLDTSTTSKETKKEGENKRNGTVLCCRETET